MAPVKIPRVFRCSGLSCAPKEPVSTTSSRDYPRMPARLASSSIPPLTAAFASCYLSECLPGSGKRAAVHRDAERSPASPPRPSPDRQVRRNLGRRHAGARPSITPALRRRRQCSMTADPQMPTGGRSPMVLTATFPSARQDTRRSPRAVPAIPQERLPPSKAGPAAAEVV